MTPFQQRGEFEHTATLPYLQLHPTPHPIRQPRCSLTVM